MNSTRVSAALLPKSCAVRVTEVTVAQACVLLQLTAMAPTTACPRCGMPSSSVHSRYQCQLADLPWGALAVRIQLTVRKFVCRNATCTRRIFTERLPDLIATYARKTHRLITVLRAIGVAVGGQAGARLATCLRLPASAATLLRLVRGVLIPPAPALQAVGVDEWAWRRGHRYGTILRERRGDDLKAWRAEATHSGIDELARLAQGLQDDLSAITTGFTLELNNGVTEGQIHRLKRVKRQRYGRNGFALVRQRVLQAA